MQYRHIAAPGAHGRPSGLALGGSGAVQSLKSGVGRDLGRFRRHDLHRRPRECERANGGVESAVESRRVTEEGARGVADPGRSETGNLAGAFRCFRNDLRAPFQRRASRGRREIAEPGQCRWPDKTSVELTNLLGIALETGLIDVGGGASILADRLLARGSTDLTVLDVSQAPLHASRQRVGDDAPVTWPAQDVPRPRRAPADEGVP